MKFLKHILVVVALLATMLPCGHAALHHGHHHDADVERCGITAEPCSCHSCEHQPCAEKLEIQTVRMFETPAIVHPAIPILLFSLPEAKPALRQTRPPAVGMLAALRTVQLLI